MNAFKEYLISKKIDPAKFSVGQPKLYGDFEIEFEEMHINSFSAQKIFLINKIRRSYPFMEAPLADTPKSTPKPRPKMVPRIKK